MDIDELERNIEQASKQLDDPNRFAKINFFKKMIKEEKGRQDKY